MYHIDNTLIGIINHMLDHLIFSGGKDRVVTYIMTTKSTNMAEDMEERSKTDSPECLAFVT